MKTMKFDVTFDCDEDGVWVAECPSIPVTEVDLKPVIIDKWTPIE